MQEFYKEDRLKNPHIRTLVNSHINQTFIAASF